MPVKTTYYSDDEKQAIEHIAERNDESFSAVVRQAVQGHYNISEVLENDE